MTDVESAPRVKPSIPASGSLGVGTVGRTTGTGVGVGVESSTRSTGASLEQKINVNACYEEIGDNLTVIRL